MASPDIAPPPRAFDLEVETLIIGAGAGGMVAALAAHESGQDVLVVEADPVPSGSTALSAGLIPAAGTNVQISEGIDDSQEAFIADIQAKAKHENDPELVTRMVHVATEVIDWLCEEHGLPFSLVTNFDYPGHSHRRMHGLPARSGAALVDALRSRLEALEIPLVCNRRATRLFSDIGRVCGAELTVSDGQKEAIGARKILLCCNGFGGNRALVRQHMPEIESALWFGHDGNRGEALSWGEALGARTGHLGAYQGHGNVAHPHGILITWATVTEGGFQVNRDGERFWDESQGYSEAARAVLAQPGGIAWTVFDACIAEICRQFTDFKDAEAAGALLQAESIESLAAQMNVSEARLRAGFAAEAGPDAFGRDRKGKGLQPPYLAVKVTGALFHTQGGLVVNPATAQVRRTDGPETIPGLYAVGGAAVGVSGSGDSGYLSGNGLLSAVALGYIAGRD